MIWNQNKHTCQIDKIKKTNPRFLHWYIHWFYLENFTGTKKKNIAIRFKMRNVEIFSSFEELMAPLIIFNVIIRGTFMYFAMQNPRSLLILDWWVEERYKTDNLNVFHFSEWMLFGHKGIYDYLDFTQKVVEAAEIWDKVQ